MLELTLSKLLPGSASTVRSTADEGPRRSPLLRLSHKISTVRHLARNVDVSKKPRREGANQSITPLEAQRASWHPTLPPPLPAPSSTASMERSRSAPSLLLGAAGELFGGFRKSFGLRRNATAMNLAGINEKESEMSAGEFLGRQSLMPAFPARRQELEGASQLSTRLLGGSDACKHVLTFLLHR